MRVRSLVVIAVLLPMALGAQRRVGVGRIGGRAAPPAELPPQPGTIANEMRYVRLPISAESYTFVSYNQAPTAAEAFGSWGNLAVGTKFSLRLNNAFAATADLTQSLFLGQMSMSTVELGTRFRPGGNALDVNARTQFFVDARLGYSSSYESYFFAPDPTAVNPMLLRGARYGTGFGAIGGFGSDFALTRTMSLTTGFWGARSRLQSRSLNPMRPMPSTGERYYLTSYRLSLGLKWNPVRAVRYE